MLAAYYDRYGPPDVVELRDLDRPVPIDDQVLVRVKAASVNRADSCCGGSRSTPATSPGSWISWRRARSGR